MEKLNTNKELVIELAVDLESKRSEVKIQKEMLNCAERAMKSASKTIKASKAEIEYLKKALKDNNVKVAPFVYDDPDGDDDDDEEAAKSAIHSVISAISEAMKGKVKP